MPDPTDPPPSTEPPSSAGDPRASRRRLLQGALATAPVLMTLVSRPVLARQCTSPSGFVSANASTAGRGVDCIGHTPEYWANPLHFGEWPSPYKATTPPGPASRFNTYFNPKINPGNPTFLAVLQGNAGTGNPTTDNVAKYLVAALLNAGPPVLSPVLLGPAIMDIWSEFATTGSFSPSAYAHWDANEIIEYVLTTMQ